MPGSDEEQPCSERAPEPTAENSPEADPQQRDLPQSFDRNSSVDEETEQIFEQNWQARRARRGVLNRLPHTGTIIPALLIYALFWLVSLWAWQHGQSELLEAEQRLVFVQGEYYRLFTSLFIHDDSAHLLANGWLFVVFGWFLCEAYGLKIFPLASFVMGVITAGLGLWSHGPDVHLLGASGMVYAMIAFWLISYLRYEKRYSFWVRMMRALAFILVMLIPSELRPHTSYWSHFWGFVVGATFAIMLLPINLSKTR